MFRYDRRAWNGQLCGGVSEAHAADAACGAHLQVLLQRLARAAPHAAVGAVLARDLGEEALLLVLPPEASAHRLRRAPRVCALQAVAAEVGAQRCVPRTGQRTAADTRGRTHRR